MVCDQYKRLESSSTMTPNQKWNTHTHTHGTPANGRKSSFNHCEIIEKHPLLVFRAILGRILQNLYQYSSGILNTFAMDNQQLVHKCSSKGVVCSRGLFLPAMLDMLGVRRWEGISYNSQLSFCDLISSVVYKILRATHLHSAKQPASSFREKSVGQSTMEPSGSLNKGRERLDSYQRCCQNPMPMATVTIWNL